MLALQEAMTENPGDFMVAFEHCPAHLLGGGVWQSILHWAKVTGILSGLYGIWAKYRVLDNSVVHIF